MSRANGFSLIELVVALVVAGIVLSVALPAFGNYRNSMALKQANAQVLQDVRRARQLAITRRAPVIMTFGNPPGIGNITSYTIHVDGNADGVVQSSEVVTLRNMPRGTRLQLVNLTPTDVLPFDISGVLQPGAGGGRLILQNTPGRRDTLMVSTAGICYRP